MVLKKFLETDFFTLDTLHVAATCSREKTQYGYTQENVSGKCCSEPPLCECLCVAATRPRYILLCVYML